MKAIIDWILDTFEVVSSFIATYIGELLAVGIAVRQFIIGDWFGGIVAVVVAGVIFLVEWRRD